MELDNAWYYNVHNLVEGGFIGCPLCKKYANHKAWQEVAVAFDGQPNPILAIVCPHCGRTYDYLHDTFLVFTVRPPQE